MGWQLTQCLWHDKQQLNTLLASWKPFAIGKCEAGPMIWLRRQVSTADAAVIEQPRRPRTEAAPR